MIEEIIAFLNERECVEYHDAEGYNIDIDKTVGNLGITIKEDDLDDTVHGLVCRDQNEDDQFVISIRKNLPEEFRKMTVAHELGHALLHFSPQKSSEYTDSVFYNNDLDEYTREEKEANLFAGEFILPENKFRKYIRKNTDDQGKIDLSKVAQAFGVSISTVGARAHELHIIY